MSIREIPASYEHKCDSCGIVTTDSTKSRPSYWSTLIIEQDAYDYQGCAVADGTIRRSLCRDCTAEVVSAINNPASTRDDVLEEAAEIGDQVAREQYQKPGYKEHGHTYSMIVEGAQETASRIRSLKGGKS